MGGAKKLKIFGKDYDTLDGTGARDYIHVVDLAKAHLKALQFQLKLKPFEILNIGSGKALTVLELVKSFETVVRRKGDLSAFWANVSLACDLINWEASFGVDQMCKDNWRWQKNNPKGYNFNKE